MPGNISRRPSGGSVTGGGHIASSRPSMGTLPTPSNRLGSLGNRPGGGNIASRPSVGTRPGAGAIAGSRPGAGGLPTTRDLNNFLDLPNVGGGNFGGGRPSSGLGNAGAAFGGALAGGAAAEFLSNRPSNALPGAGGRPGMGDIASTLPANPGGIGGNRPDVGRPGTPGNRPDNSLPDTRPDLGRPGQPDLGRPGRPDVGRPGRPDMGRPGRPGDHIQALPSRITDRSQWQNWRQDNRNDMRDFIRTHPGSIHNWFEANWWSTHRIEYPYYPGFGYWGWAAWAPLTGWVDSGWTDPIYYNYGENVYYQDGNVYYGDQPVCTEAQYIEQAEAIAESVPDTKPAAKDWMPLGVFAITQDGEPTGAEPTMFLQLAVSKQGILNGTFQNTATGTVKVVEGMVDKETQRAAWAAKDERRPLMETGIANLTHDLTPALVHFPDNSTQQVLLVRLEEPKSAAK